MRVCVCACVGVCVCACVNIVIVFVRVLRRLQAHVQAGKHIEDCKRIFRP